MQGIAHNALYTLRELICEEQFFVSDNDTSSSQQITAHNAEAAHTMEEQEMAEQARARWQRVSRANQASRMGRALSRRRRRSAGRSVRLTLSATELAAQWEIFLQRLQHDIGSALECRLQSTLLDAMETAIQEMALAPALDLVDNAQQHLRLREQSVFLQPRCACERMVRGLVQAFTFALLRRQSEEVRALISKWRAQLPSTPPPPQLSLYEHEHSSESVSPSAES